jgi:hypothetical protein
MGNLKSLVIIGVVLIAGLLLVENSPGQDQPDNTKSASKTAAERQKMDWWRQRRASRARDSALKAHMKHQTKAVRKRMRKDAKRAEKTN